MTKKLRLGTRASALATWQAEWVAGELRRLGREVELVRIRTSGDHQQSGPIINIGATGVFTKEIQRALLDGRVDLAVHSMKDLPTEPIPGLSIAAVPLRADIRDAFISPRFDSFADLPPKARIGTGSLRRKCQLLYRFGDRYRIDDIRGNVETRLAKLDAGDYDAVILAVAGLRRLGLADRIRPESILSADEFLPAVGQGALAVEARTDDREAVEVARLLDNESARRATFAERGMLLTLRGGCIAPIGARVTFENDVLTLHGRILSLDGTECYDASESISLPDDADRRGESADTESFRLGCRVAEELIRLGADRILDEIDDYRS